MQEMRLDGKTLKAMRISSGATQSELAAYLGYYTKGEPNRSVISRMENGTQDINSRIEMLVTIFLTSKGASHE